MMPGSALQNLLLEIERATWPWLSGAPNSFGWGQEQFEHHMEATARFLRAHLGMPEQIETFEPDPVVILPKGFTGFTINNQPAPPSAVPYTPPVPTIYLPAGTDPATIAQHRNTTPTPATSNMAAPTPTPTPAPAPAEASPEPSAESREHTITTPIPADADITPYWEAVEHHLGDQAPEILNPPATDEEITALETTLGLTLPTQLRASLARHNGMGTYPEDNFPGEILLSCEEIIDQYETWQQVFDDLDEDTRNFNLSGDTGLTLPGFWNHGWIPITDDGTGNAYVTDTTPGPNGTTGQIISITTDGPSPGVIYPNLATLLHHYVHGED
ncbi:MULTISPECIES: SMI1/KNR4 family protein [Kocuria]|uniref:Knr4/Smi1-like domain-containing protein n=1 Tax=Kocuria subflava TaxID=1736139 RepID=A0A846TUM2_9MICC|nr:MULTISPECIES: SMI1/KNR4 family protein [Kocuria]NKE10539.1 hypothetical protein [Kocuria subflava]